MKPLLLYALLTASCCAEPVQVSFTVQNSADGQLWQNGSTFTLPYDTTNAPFMLFTAANLSKDGFVAQGVQPLSADLLRGTNMADWAWIMRPNFFVVPIGTNDQYRINAQIVKL